VVYAVFLVRLTGVEISQDDKHFGAWRLKQKRIRVMRVSASLRVPPYRTINKFVQSEEIYYVTPLHTPQMRTMRTPPILYHCRHFHPDLITESVVVALTLPLPSPPRERLESWHFPAVFPRLNSEAKSRTIFGLGTFQLSKLLHCLNIFSSGDPSYLQVENAVRAALYSI
jgi:hypothetical protein